MKPAEVKTMRNVNEPLSRTSQLFAAAGLALLASCGGGNDTSSERMAQASTASRDTSVSGSASLRAEAVTQGSRSQSDAVRLAQQATFGPTEALVTEIRTVGPARWLSSQLALNVSRYTSGGTDDMHKNVGAGGVLFCERDPFKNDPHCYVNYFTSTPLMQDFYRNVTKQPDQLRQRVAFALQHLLVISNTELTGTYGFRNYYNRLLGQAFGNYRDVLRSVTMSPLMGDYLDHVNNDKAAPNENFARELLQLFTIGTCKLEIDGSLSGGTCQATYDNPMVRNYAYALTGWTYPSGGSIAGGCEPVGSNCQYYAGDMVPLPALHDTESRPLLAGVTVPAGTTPAQALERVLDSVMKHPNIAPFIATRLIQHLVVSNPRPAYVQRVAEAFIAGRFQVGEQSVGTGIRGDLAATVAAILLDADARYASLSRNEAGFLRQPVLFFSGVLRALNGTSNGADMGGWGETLREDVFRPPSIFNFYPPNYPVVGTPLIGPEFGIHNVNGALNRLNYLDWLLYQGGSKGTQVDLSAFVATAGNAGALVDRLSLLALGKTLASEVRSPVVKAVAYWNATTAPTDWETQRINTAAYLVFGSPDYEVQP